MTAIIEFLVLELIAALEGCAETEGEAVSEVDEEVAIQTTIIEESVYRKDHTYRLSRPTLKGGKMLKRAWSMSEMKWLW